MNEILLIGWLPLMIVGSLIYSFIPVIGALMILTGMTWGISIWLLVGFSLLHIYVKSEVEK